MYDAGGRDRGSCEPWAQRELFSMAPVGTDAREMNCAMPDRAIAWDPVA
jgi:hypothetical protein